MSILEIIKANKTYSIFLKESINKAQDMLMENEKVLYAIGGNITVIDNKELLKIDFWKIKGKVLGILVITDKRVMFCNYVLGSGQAKEILSNNIQSVESKDVSLLGIGKLRIKGITETFIIDISRKETIEHVKNAIYKCKEEKIVGNAISNAEEIRKYKELLDEGIITPEEFEKKKRELLK